MNQFIDVFYVPNEDPRKPYHCFIWRSGRIVDASQHKHLASVAEWCRRRDLPVRAGEARVRTELRTHGIAAQVIVAAGAGVAMVNER